MTAPSTTSSSAAEPSAYRFRARGLSHRYGDRVALDGLSFALQPGELLAFVGPNGAGKTTLFRILCGLVTPATGTLELDGAVVTGADARLRRQVGVVFQEPSLDDRLTVAENLRMFAAIFRIPRADADQRISRLLNLVHLVDRAGERTDRLSGGMRRRVELVRALLPSPRILLLDEPTTGVDMAGVVEFWTYIDEIRAREGMGVLLTTHRADEAERASRVVLMDHGREVVSGTPQELLQRAGSDVLEIETPEPAAIVTLLDGKHGLSGGAVMAGRARFDVVEGARAIPPVMETLAGRRIMGVHVRRPGMAEVFVTLTGRALADEGHAP